MRHQRAAFLAAAAGMFLFGLATALLGAILPVLSARLRFTLGDAGTLFLTLNLGVFLCVFGLGRWIDERGMKAPMAAGPALVAVALIMMTAAADFRGLLAAALLLGMGGGALNVTTNTLVADLYGEAQKKNSALNLLGLFYGLGGLLIPAGLGALLNRVGFEPVLWFAALISLAAGAYGLALEFPEPKHAGRASRGPLGNRLVLILTAALLFFQSGTEVTLAGYTTTFLVSEFRMPVASASWGLTVLWIAVTLARLALARLALRIQGHRIVMASSAMTLLGCALLLQATSAAMAVAALCVVGAGLSGVFPTVLGMTGALYSGSSGTVFGLLLTVSRTGSMALPYGAGNAAEHLGIRSAIWIVAVSTALVLGLEEARHRAARRGRV